MNTAHRMATRRLVNPTNRPALAPLDRARAHEVAWQQVAPLFNAASACGTASFVYVIGEPDDGAVKIGYAKDPITRLRDMQTGNPRQLRIEHVVIGRRSLEQELLELWRPFAIVSAAKRGRVDVPPLAFTIGGDRSQAATKRPRYRGAQ